MVDIFIAMSHESITLNWFEYSLQLHVVFVFTAENTGATGGVIQAAVTPQTGIPGGNPHYAEALQQKGEESMSRRMNCNVGLGVESW